MDDLAQYIQRRLDEERPERYQVGDTSWRDPIYTEVTVKVNIVEARQIAARQLVDRCEGNATRGANDLLRRVGKTEQWPLDWMDVSVRPIAVGDERIQLGSATAKDFRQWAIDERRDAAQDFSARSAACDGAEWIATQLVTLGYTTFGDAVRNVAAA